MKFSKLKVLCCAAAMSAYAPVAMAADVVIGVPNWPSVQATAHILKVALESKLNVEVQLKNGSNTAVFDAMDAGTMHVHPEAWLPNLNHRQRTPLAVPMRVHPIHRWLHQAPPPTR